MTNPDLFNNTVNTLVQAFFDGTLEKGNCRACAVGNICNSSAWAALFMTQGVPNSSGGIIHVRKFADDGQVLASNAGLGTFPIAVESLENKDLKRTAIEITKEAYKVIAESGYTKSQLMRIENEFERAGSNHKEDYNSFKSQFESLMAVLDVLFDIHDVESDEIPAIRSKFEEHPELVEA